MKKIFFILFVFSFSFVFADKFNLIKSFQVSEDFEIFKEFGKNDFLESKKLINKVYPDLNHDELKILKLFQHEIEIYYDDLIKLSNLTTEKVDRILVKLELMNIIIRLKGKKYQFKGLQNLLKPI